MFKVHFPRNDNESRQLMFKVLFPRKDNDSRQLMMISRVESNGILDSLTLNFLFDIKCFGRLHHSLRVALQSYLTNRS